MEYNTNDPGLVARKKLAQTVREMRATNKDMSSSDFHNVVLEVAVRGADNTILWTGMTMPEILDLEPEEKWGFIRSSDLSLEDSDEDALPDLFDVDPVDMTKAVEAAEELVGRWARKLINDEINRRRLASRRALMKMAMVWKGDGDSISGDEFMQALVLTCIGASTTSGGPACFKSMGWVDVEVDGGGVNWKYEASGNVDCTEEEGRELEQFVSVEGHVDLDKLILVLWKHIENAKNAAPYTGNGGEK